MPRTAKITDICFAFVCENILKVEFWHVVKWMKVIPVCVQAKNGEMRSTLQFFYYVHFYLLLVRCIAVPILFHGFGNTFR